VKSFNRFTLVLAFNLRYWYRFLPLLFIYASVLLWIGIFFLQPHKEERFLFPIFPLIALLAAVGLQSLSYFMPNFRLFNGVIVFLFVLISVSRGYALHRNYSASIETYKAFHNHFLVNSGKLNLTGMHVSVIKYFRCTKLLGSNSIVCWQRMASFSVLILYSRASN
jgi:hypothetical protein